MSGTPSPKISADTLVERFLEMLTAERNAERLLTMLEHLLTLARLEQARDAFVVGPHAAGDLLRAAADNARPRAEDRHQELIVEAPDDLPPVASDAGPSEGGTLREYGLGAQVLRALGLRKIRVLTNNPRKIAGIQGYGLEVVESVALGTKK